VQIKLAMPSCVRHVSVQRPLPLQHRFNTDSIVWLIIYIAAVKLSR
jgi:hypothetical protein